MNAIGLELKSVTKTDLSFLKKFTQLGSNEFVECDFDEEKFVKDFRNIPNDLIQKIQTSSKSLTDLSLGLNIILSGDGLDLIIQPVGSVDDLLNQNNFRVQKFLFYLNENSSLYAKVCQELQKINY